MNDLILNLEERIQNAIGLGESHFREFKSAFEGPPNNKQPRESKKIRKDIGETLVAFANADGGELIVGVEDNGEITGVPHSEEKIQELMRAHLSQVYAETPLPSPLIRTLEVSNKIIIYFSVEKCTRYVHLTSDGRCLQRKDRESVPVSSEHIVFERQEKISREYDRVFVDGASVSDLDSRLLQTVANDLTPGMSVEKCLQWLGLGEYTPGGIKLKKAALLLFSQNIQRWHPRCEIRILKIIGNELFTGRDYNVASDDTCSDHIFGLVSKGWELLRPHLVETKFIGNSLFKEVVMYPEDACREALINAIAHRDYSIEGRNIEVYVFDNRMEVRSPGGLLSTVSIQSLKTLTGLHQSRNALIARTLRELGYMREMGEGIRRIYSLMKSHDLVSPELVSTRDNFSIILQNSSVFSQVDQLWLDDYEDFDLTRQEKLLLMLGRNGNLISPQQVFDVLDLVDTEDYRLVIDQLLIKGIIFTKVSKPVAKSISYKKRIKQREVGRFAIRPPHECKKFISELLLVLRDIGKITYFNNAVLKTVTDKLSYDNPYKTKESRLLSALKVLGLVDDSRSPRGKLAAVYGVTSTKAQPIKQLELDKYESDNLETDDDLEISKAQIKSLFIHNLAYEVTENDLVNAFSVYGKVVNIRVPIDYQTGKPRGFAFVEMDSFKNAKKVILSLNETIISGRIVYIEWHKFGK